MEEKSLKKKEKTFDMGRFPFPRSSDPSATTIDRPIMSVTLTSLSANLNSARPLSSAITGKESTSCPDSQ